MGPMQCLMFSLFIVSFLLLFQMSSVLDKRVRRSSASKLANDPLYLTPLIEAGDLEKARNISAVPYRLDMRGVKSYSGFLTVDKQYNSNFFFWYFPAKINPDEAPVLLWLQGSPGVSSLSGLFTENGPFVVSEHKKFKYLDPSLRQYSWHVNHNLLYMDNPIGAGFSFSENNAGFAANASAAGRALYSALLQFFTLFPLDEREFFIAGESLAGKYIPAVAKLIKDSNPAAAVKMNLKGLAVGNGLFDPYNQLNQSDYLYQLGLVDFIGRDAMKLLEYKTRRLIEQEDWQRAFDAMNGIPALFQNLTGFNFSGNFLNASEANGTTWYADYLRRPDVQRALHVGGVDFDDQSSLVLESMRLDVPKSTAAYLLPELLEHYRVLIYSGQLDALSTATMTENFLRKLAWSGAEEYRGAARRAWTVDREFAGYAKTVRNLTEVLVRNAGRRVAADQPKWAWDLITRFTHGQPF